MFFAVMTAVVASGCIEEPLQYGDISFSGRLEVMAPDYYTDMKMDNAGYMNVTKYVGMQRYVGSQQMSASRLDILKGLVMNSDFFELKDSYVDWDVDNGTSYILDIMLGNRSNKVLCYEECPESALAIRHIIEGYWGHAL